MYRIDWSELALGGFLKDLKGLAKADVKDATLLPLLAAILKGTGGLPIAFSDWTTEEKRLVASRLFSEAVNAILVRGYGFSRVLPGCDTVKGDGSLGEVIVPHSRVSVNLADAETLAALPVIGPSLAARMIESRRTGGYFKTAFDLIERVNGIGPVGAERLGLVLDYEELRTPVGHATGDMEIDFASLLALQEGDTAETKLIAALDAVASFVAADPHPATRHHRSRTELLGGGHVLDLFDTESVEILEDEAYYGRAVEILAAAQDRIDVAMFFAAMPFKGHPTFKLIDLLCDAHDEGKAVRVLMDQDRVDDPYNSTAINAEAIAYLKSRGVAVRVDAPEKLMHSKTIAVDGTHSIIGSHNWTAGSYFKYRDVSLAIASAELTGTLHARFDVLWDAGVET